jgi:hypothetical protein
MQITYGNDKLEINTLPDKCPFCHNGIRPTVLNSFMLRADEMITLQVFLNCPMSDCHESFIGYYQSVSYYGLFSYLNYTSKGNMIGRNFSDEIKNVSELFSNIYNQSYHAEQLQLFEICGVGYRKSLEFLIKDYAIQRFPDEKLNIEKKMLAQCIGDYVNDDKIKAVSKRAVWLGNDETHYIRKWEGKNLTDLKKLIDLTLHWIEAEILTDSFIDEMPG